MMAKRDFGVMIGLLAVAVGVVSAERPIADERSAVMVKITPPSGGQAANDLARSLKVALERDRFAVEVLADEPRSLQECVNSLPQVGHVIAAVVADQTNHKAVVYTQGMPSPASLEGRSIESLTAQVVDYLESEEMVRYRAEKRAASMDPSAGDLEAKFLSCIDLGLRHMAPSGNLSEAIAAFEEAKRLKPASPLPYANLALCYRWRGDYDRCQECVTEGLIKDPENHDLKNLQAILLMRNGSLGDAIAILETLRKDDLIAQWNLAYAYQENKQTDEAMAHLERILELSPGSAIGRDAVRRLQQFKMTRRALWFAVGGLLCVGTIALILVVLRRTGGYFRGVKDLKPADVLALRVQLGIALLSGLFGILPLVLGRVLGG